MFNILRVHFIQLINDMALLYFSGYICSAMSKRDMTTRVLVSAVFRRDIMRMKLLRILLKYLIYS